MPRAGTGPPPPSRAFGTLVVSDVLGELWGLSEQRGALLVSTDQAAVITANRLIEVGDSGRAGSALPVVSRDDLATSGSAADFIWTSRDGTLDLYAADAGTEVEVSLLDETGQPLGSRSFKSGEAVHRLELSSLSDTGWTAARIEVRVKSGRACFSLDVRNGATGRWATTAPITDGMNGQEFLVVPAFHSSA